MYRFRHTPDGGGHWVMARYREQAPVIRMRHPVFLQRYATWCVRTNRFASAGGAACLSKQLRGLSATD
jgi:hypothetical protein